LRLDIEGLRAVALLLVLAFHAELGPFGGGYLGVDVFFVVSGFLITSLLLNELEQTGFLTLPAFWARRARRLLPASSLVIVFTLVAGAMVLDPLAVRDLAREALAAATFVINIVFAHRQSDYLAAQLPPSPLLHFWSLAVEEQFYLLWPLLLQLAAGYRRHKRLSVAFVIAVLWPLSFVACVRLTRSDQPWAFFSLPTRAWELLTGAALALVADRLHRLPGLLRSAIGWAGLVTILVTAVVYSTTTAFPGPAAVWPVLATAAVILAGPIVRHGPIAVLRLRPLTWIGARSYSIYLWHWPFLVLATARFGPLSAEERLATTLASVAVAAATYKVLEDPVRHSKWLAAKARRGLMMGGGLIMVSVTTSALVVTSAPSLVGAGAAVAPVVINSTAPPTTAAGGVRIVAPPPTAAAAIAPAGTDAVGAADTLPPPEAALVPTSISTSAPPPVATAPPTTQLSSDQLAAINVKNLTAGTLTHDVPANLRPSLRQVRSDLPAIYHDGCHLDPAVTVPPPCVFGDPASATTVVLFGDSHAAQWFPAMEDLATRHHWRLVVMTKKGCPTASISVFSPIVNRELRECDPWRSNVIKRIAAEHPALVVMSSYRYRQTGAWAGIEPNEAWRRGLGTTLDALAPLTRQVLVLGDTPTPAHDVPSCVSAHLRDVARCIAARRDAVHDDRLSVEREVAAAHRAAFISTSNWLCSPTDCPVIVGDLLVYRDANHITAHAATWLMPYLEAAVVPLVG